MNKRDTMWRGSGAVLCLAAGTVALTADSPPLAVLLFLVILLGLTLMINGKRVAIALQAERRGHHHTAEVIHARRIRRFRGRTDEAR
jgi:uncharacterized membrane protein HdeD (DUF308 family)